VTQPSRNIRSCAECPWPEYRGSVGDTHELEIFEHSLEPAQETEGRLAAIVTRDTMIGVALPTAADDYRAADAPTV
jgi:hypothetical protein